MAAAVDRCRPAAPVPLDASMRLIVARCEVRYSGWLNAVLPEALRLLMLKADGSVMVHADTGGIQAPELRLALLGCKLGVKA